MSQFSELFPDNESCEKHLTEQRLRNGFVCPECGHLDYWFLSNRKLFDCKNCRHQTSITAGTIFHSTRVSVYNWYLLIFTMMVLEEGAVISEMQRLLGIGSYKTAWLMAHKIRKAMAEMDERLKFAGLVKINVSYFRSKLSMPIGSTSNHRVVLLAVATYRNNNGESKLGAVRMAIVNNDSTQSIKGFLQTIDRGIKPGDITQLLNRLCIEGWRSYTQDSNSDNLVHVETLLLDSEPAGRLLPWIDRIISHAKDVILIRHRGVSHKNIDAYLSEIVFRFNHSHWDIELFNRLIRSCLKTDKLYYKNLVHPT
jgi:transcription elongation factor Elf1